MAKSSSSAWPQAAKRFTRFKALPAADTVYEGNLGRRGKWSVEKIRRAGLGAIFQGENLFNHDDDDDDDDDDDIINVVCYNVMGLINKKFWQNYSVFPN